jgi:hypothetical protein
VHPLDVFFFRPPGQALHRLFQVVLPSEPAGLLAARLLVAVIAGAGVGCLAVLALQHGLELISCLLLFSMYFLFTSSSTIALPEHFGMSNGLLSIAFAVPIIVTHPGLRTAALSALVVLCGGTTITNVLYPLASVCRYGVNSRRARRTMLAAVAIAAAMAVFLYVDSRRVVFSQRAILPALVPGVARLYLKSTVIHIYVTEYMNLRLIHEPVSAVVTAIYALVAPAVGPSPLVRRQPGWDLVTYEPSHEPLRLGYYWGPQAVGAVLWAVLLLSCSYQAIKDPGTRRFVWLPLGWLLFNMVFHNLWGDELILYAPHWSWALMGLVLLGARHLSRTAVASMVIPIVACQAYTLFQIKSALLTITR